MSDPIKLPVLQPTSLQQKLPIKLSVSKVKVWTACKKQFEYNYILRMPKLDKDYLVFGKILHKALEEFHKAYILGSTDSPATVMSVAWKLAKAEFAHLMTSDALIESKRILSQYIKMVANKPPSFLTNVKSTEQAFNFHLTDRVILNGFIDKVHKEDDGVLLVADYKTTKNKKYLQDDWFQLLTYAFVLMSEDLTLDTVRVAYILLRHDFEHIERIITRDEAMTVRDQYLAYASDIEEAKEYPANPTHMCRFCDFIELCDEGKAAVYGKPKFGEISW